MTESNNGEQSFAELFEASLTEGGGEISVGDKITGAIISIEKEYVFVDTGAKLDGVVEKAELLDENGEFPFKEGDSLDLYVISMKGGSVTLSKALGGAGGMEMLENAFHSALPVEGKVKGTCKGGFNVEVMHSRAFCPVSQIDDKYVEDPSVYVGQTLPFLVVTFEQRGRNIVVSRRKILDREREESTRAFLEGTQVGAEVEAKITRLAKFGAFAEIAPGLDGMIHISELSWSRIERPEDAVAIGDVVKVKITAIEMDEKRNRMKISLSIKQATADPWDTAEGKFAVGDIVTGKVVRCLDFGAFVEIAPGIEGLVHVSELSHVKRVNKPEEVVNPGDVVSVKIKDVDLDKRRISLSLKDAGDDPWQKAVEKYAVGQTVSGTVEKKQDFGLFVNLEPGVTGLLPKSKMASSANASELSRLNPGDAVSLTVIDIQPAARKITLAPAGEEQNEDWKSYAGTASSPSKSNKPGKPGQDKSQPQGESQGLGMGLLAEKLQDALAKKKE